MPSFVHAGQSKLKPEVQYVTKLIKSLNNLCPGESDGKMSPPVECACDNAADLTVKPPFDLGPVGFFKLLGCAPSNVVLVSTTQN